MNFSDCPRCGWKSLDVMKTYSYCANCNYNSVEDESDEIPFHIQLLAEEREQRRRKKKKINEISNSLIKKVQEELLLQEKK